MLIRLPLAILLLSLLGPGFAEPKLQTSKTLKPPLKLIERDHIRMGALLVLGLVHARELQELKQNHIQGMKREGALTDIPGFSPGRNGNERRIGARVPQPEQPKGSGIPNDPLDAHRGARPGSILVGPGAVPGKDSLTRQDSGTDYGSRSEGRRGSVWVERSTSRQSSDGSRTWGSTMYRDTSGNHWRADYTDTRGSDGGVVSKDTIFGAHNEPIKTTVRESSPDGSATETTTTHATGEVQQRTGTFGEIFPERSVDPDAPAGGNAVAPRGWYNPVTGASNNAGLKTNNNQVNPGREPAQPQATVPPLMNKRDLVINPAPDALVNPIGKPRDIREGDPTIVDPPRPQ